MIVINFSELLSRKTLNGFTKGRCTTPLLHKRLFKHNKMEKKKKEKRSGFWGTIIRCFV